MNLGSSSYNAPAHLFTSPAELRNQIYTYALTSPRALHYHPHPCPPKLIITDSETWLALPAPFNTLKYVCHKVYFEICGLKFRLNSLTFTQYTNMVLTPSTGLYCFIDNICDGGFAQLAHVVLKLAFGNHLPPAGVFTTVQWCEVHPKVSARHILGDFIFGGINKFQPNTEIWDLSLQKQAGTIAKGFP